MNTIWSSYVQTTEELYESRAIRFTASNCEVWLNALGLKPESKLRVLEIGCAGGLFCHRLAEFCPSLEIIGLDRDSAHIDFARRKTVELGLGQCEFIVGDAGELPFANDSFDLVFSHTVSEHIPPEKFYPEQYRVLKPGGRITVLSARPPLAVKDDTWNIGTPEERSLLEKAWSNTIDFEGSDEIGKYSIPVHEHPKMLEKYGFGKVDMSLFSVVDYAPDNASTKPDDAIKQINAHRIGILCMVEKTKALAPTSLTEEERTKLISLINSRFDARIEKYKNGEHVWDFSTSAILAVSAIKQ